jgi:hypothetical protein
MAVRKATVSAPLAIAAGALRVTDCFHSSGLGLAGGAVMIDDTKRARLASTWPLTADIAKEAGHKPISVLKAIRLKCLDCCGGQPSEVRHCTAIDCPLWPYRAGTNPLHGNARRLAENRPVLAKGSRR